MSNEMTIDIDDYLSEEEKKELCIEYVRETLRGEGNERHKERVLSNIAYEAGHKILDEALSQEDLANIRKMAKKTIFDKGQYGIFRKKNAWCAEDSLAYLEVKKAVEEHKHEINGLVLEAIRARDYDKDLQESSAYLGEVLVEAITEGLKEK